MENKEYLKTTFPDGTPVKIYPVKDTLTQEIHFKSQERPGVISGVLNALFYKDLVVVTKESDIDIIRKECPNIKHFISVDNRYFKWLPNERR